MDDENAPSEGSSEGDKEEDTEDDKESTLWERATFAQCNLPGFNEFKKAINQKIIDPNTPTEEVTTIIETLQSYKLIAKVNFAHSQSNNKPDLERDIFQQRRFEPNDIFDAVAYKSISSKKNGCEILHAKNAEIAETKLAVKLQHKPITDISQDELNEIAPPNVCAFEQQHSTLLCILPFLIL